MPRLGQTCIKLYTLFRTDRRTIPWPAACPCMGHLRDYPPPAPGIQTSSNWPSELGLLGHSGWELLSVVTLKSWEWLLHGSSVYVTMLMSLISCHLFCSLHNGILQSTHGTFQIFQRNFLCPSKGTIWLEAHCLEIRSKLQDLSDNIPKYTVKHLLTNTYVMNVSLLWRVCLVQKGQNQSTSSSAVQTPL